MQSIMIGELSLYEVFAYFFIYAFLGWIAEVVYHALKEGNFANRGFLNGPVCPIYGVGVTAILLILGSWIDKPWLVFLVGFVFCSLIEFIVGWALEKFFHNKWWDYSDKKFNVKGYICLEFSILWGLAVVLVADVLHPLVRTFAGLLGETAGTVVICVLGAITVADIVVSVLQVLKLNRKLSEIDAAAKALRLGSDFIGGKISDATVVVDKGVDKVKEAASEKLEPLKEKKERLLDTIAAKMPKRLLKAFPSLSSRVNPDAVALAKESLKRKRNKSKADTVADGGAENNDLTAKIQNTEKTDPTSRSSEGDIGVDD